jgi:16S rRNA G966 N2-methylase RsmD
MGLQTMSNIEHVSEELSVGRSDPTYMAHAYLTKVPTPAIVPFIQAYTQPGDIVVDPFAGSGMTGVAAMMTGRRARLSDISVLGQHIGSNFANLVDAERFLEVARQLVASSEDELGHPYKVECRRCHEAGTLAKTVWSVVVECSHCRKAVNYYHAMEAADWRKPDMVCPHCGTPVNTKNRRLGEEAVLDSISSACSKTLLDQEPTAIQYLDVSALNYPRVDITPDREMYKASALAKNGRTTIASFYSARNLAVLASLRSQIRTVSDKAIRDKLLFAFTACLTRASKRYQWSRQRPLNAANANYYVAPVFYEWNVYELFVRKLAAVLKSDAFIKEARRTHVSGKQFDEPDVRYTVASAEHLDLADQSADYVFTDPPFGSNLFYADMALFQEAWLDGFTDVTQEAVVDRSRGGKRTAIRYESLLTAALSECNRVVKPGGRVSMVFGNSSGSMWALVQRAIRSSGLVILPEELVVLNKGQRSVKGLASGFEDVATLDLIITMARDDRADSRQLRPVSSLEVRDKIRELAAVEPATPSHLYLELLRTGIREGWELNTLDLRDVTAALLEDGWEIDSKTGRLSRYAVETGVSASDR